MQVWICEDEPAQRALLEGYVREFFCSAGNIAVRSFSSGNQVLFELDENVPDILLLDIQMDGIDGVQLAKRIRKRDEKTEILFVTAAVDYIYEGFNVNAVNYLLKPVKKEQLFACLEKARELAMQQEEPWLLQVGREVCRLDRSKVLYVESDDHYLEIHCQDKVYRVKMNMKDMEQELSGSRFCRMGRSYLLNLEAVDRLTPEEVQMVNGDRLPVPRGRYREISSRFITYHFGSV